MLLNVAKKLNSAFNKTSKNTFQAGFNLKIINIFQCYKLNYLKYMCFNIENLYTMLSQSL